MQANLAVYRLAIQIELFINRHHNHLLKVVGKELKKVSISQNYHVFTSCIVTDACIPSSMLLELLC
jgi:hypothetical protein